MRKKFLLYPVTLLVIIMLLAAIWFYRLVFSVSISPEGEFSSVFLPEGCSYSQAMDSVTSNLIVKNIRVLTWVAEKKNYPSHVRPGRYTFSRAISCNELINILRSGKQTPVRITFSNIRTLNELAGRVGGRIEADSSQILGFLSDQANYSKDGFTKETIISVFIPDTYEFFWNTDAKRFYSRMLKEYKRFWNEERQMKAEQKNLTSTEVSTLASIIDYEAVHADEKCRIAGVYINRLKRGMPLQADPTIKFALNDFTLKRILTRHLIIESPYNTYRYPGLPPGPIACPSVGGIDAVLNAEEHDYLYFAAKPDFSGYHNFSRTLADHNKYAAMYRHELNKRRIFR
jgi:UPF0755 protein